MWLWFSLVLLIILMVALCAGLFWPVLWQAKNPVVTLQTRRWFAPWWHYWHYLCLPLLSWNHRQYLQRLISQAGRPQLQVESTFAYQCLAVLLTFLLCALLMFLLASYAWYWLPLSLVMAAAMYWYPVSLLRRTIRIQQLELKRDIPLMLDLLTLSIEAGVGILSALQLCVTQLPSHALQHHLQITLDDLRTGLNREQAFMRFAQRTDLDEIHAFVSALQQSFELGGSLGPLLRQQAEQRRQERFLLAEKKALEAPVKMLFPLVACIFPCTFLVIGYPLFYQLSQHL